MKLLVVLYHNAFDGTDVIWNALRLVAQAQSAGMTVQVFALSDAVELARKGAGIGAEINLQAMLIEIKGRGAPVKFCKTCLERRKITPDQMCPEFSIGTMPELVEGIIQASKVLTF